MIVDYGMGNLRSVLNALSFLGCDAFISDKRGDVDSADAFILPGVGAFGEAMANLTALGLVEPLTRRVLTERKPFLGICLGMQLIAESSEENGKFQGLGWISGHVRRLPAENGIRIPHVGWNDVRIVESDPLFLKIEDDLNFYFVHTYHFACDPARVVAWCRYGADFAAAVRKDNIFAVQFHPEKSQVNGLRLLRNFCRYAGVEPARAMPVC